MGDPCPSSLVAPLGEMHVLESERLDEPVRQPIGPGIFPGRDVAEVLVVALGLSVRSLELLSEVPAARLASLERVQAHELGELHEVRHPPRMLERLIERVAVPEHVQVLPELLAKGRDLVEGPLEAGLVARHPALVPHDPAELAMEGGGGALP